MGATQIWGVLREGTFNFSYTTFPLDFAGFQLVNVAVVELTRMTVTERVVWPNLLGH